MFKFFRKNQSKRSEQAFNELVDVSKSMMKYAKVTPSKEDIKITGSKIGGLPYWDVSLDYPQDSYGNHMRLLAQINFEQLPKLENYPSKGMLQFFINAADDVYGIDFDNSTLQNGFKVIYHSEIDYDFSTMKFSPSYIDTEYFPAEVEARMEFELKESAAATTDYRFCKIYRQEAFQLFNDDEYDQYENKYSGAGHKVGGYAYFTQEDPRSYKYGEYDTLLLQLDSDDSIDMMWGDCGVANFFIKLEDLRNMKFDDILYTWDCC